MFRGKWSARVDNAAKSGGGVMQSIVTTYLIVPRCHLERLHAFCFRGVRAPTRLCRIGWFVMFALAHWEPVAGKLLAVHWRGAQSLRRAKSMLRPLSPGES